MSNKLLREVVRAHLEGHQRLNEEIPILGQLFDWLGDMLDDLVDAGIDMAEEWQSEAESALSSEISAQTSDVAKDMDYEDAPEFDKLDVQGNKKDHIMWSVTVAEVIPGMLSKAASALKDGADIKKLAPTGKDGGKPKEGEKDPEFESSKEAMGQMAGGCGTMMAVCSHLGKHLPPFEALHDEIEAGVKQPGMVDSLKAVGKAAELISADVASLVNDAKNSDKYKDKFEDHIDFDSSQLKSASKDVAGIAGKLIPHIEKLKEEMEKMAEKQKKEGGPNEALIRYYVSGLLKERRRRRI
jgi:hypothetical protein